MKSWIAVDHAQELDHLSHLVQIDQYALQAREDVDAGKPRRLVSLLGRQVAADLAGRSSSVGSICGSQPGEEEEVAGPDARDVVGDGNGFVGK